MRMEHAREAKRTLLIVLGQQFNPLSQHLQRAETKDKRRIRGINSWVAGARIDMLGEKNFLADTTKDHEPLCSGWLCGGKLCQRSLNHFLPSLCLVCGDTVGTNHSSA